MRHAIFVVLAVAVAAAVALPNARAHAEDDARIRATQDFINALCMSLQIPVDSLRCPRAEWFDTSLPEQPTQPTPEIPDRRIEIELSNSRTSFDIDYSSVCLFANFPIPSSHLVLAVSGKTLLSGNQDTSLPIHNYGRALPQPDDYNRACKDGWDYVGAVKNSGTVYAFALSSTKIERLRTFDSEALEATLWACDRHDDFLTDALFKCTEDYKWSVPYPQRETALLAIHFSGSQTRFKSRVEGLTGIVHSLEKCIAGSQYDYYFSGLPMDQWHNTNQSCIDLKTGKAIQPPVIGFTGIGGVWKGLYCLPESDELILCDVWSERTVE